MQLHKMVQAKLTLCHRKVLPSTLFLPYVWTQVPTGCPAPPRMPV